MAIQSLIPSFEPEELHNISVLAADHFEDLSGEMEEFKYLGNPSKCDARFLPYLAYAFKADLWDESLREQYKRELIYQSIRLHRIKGTRKAVLEILKAVGLSPDEAPAVIVEYKDRNDYRYNVKHDAVYSYDGSVKYNGGVDMYAFGFKLWNEYAVIIKVAMNQSQNTLARNLVEAYAPKSSSLIGFITRVQQMDGSFLYNGLYTH